MLPPIFISFLVSDNFLSWSLLIEVMTSEGSIKFNLVLSKLKFSYATLQNNYLKTYLYSYSLVSFTFSWA